MDTGKTTFPLRQKRPYLAKDEADKNRRKKNIQEAEDLVETVREGFVLRGVKGKRCQKKGASGVLRKSV